MQQQHWSRFIGVLVLTAAVAAGCATSTPYQEPIAVDAVALQSGEELGLDRLIVLFDASGSIDPKETFPGEKAWVESFVQGMPDGDYTATIRTFGGDEREGPALAPFNRDQLATVANEIEFIGEDSPLDAVLLELADELAGTGGDTAILLITDGVPNPRRYEDPEAHVLVAAQSVIDKSEGTVCIHTVQAGNDKDGEVLLESLAALTPCGSARASSSLEGASDLAAFERGMFIRAAPVVAPVIVVAAAPNDSDGDGVIDANDDCPGTPTGAPVTDRGCWVLEGLKFASGSDKIVSGDANATAAIAIVLKQNPDMRLQINGYTDSSGPAAFNEQLSARRAEAIKRELVSTGIDPTRLEAKGFGEENPIGDNKTPEGRAENRRIEFTVLR